jgi:hypothetical protein
MADRRGRHIPPYVPHFSVSCRPPEGSAMTQIGPVTVVALLLVMLVAGMAVGQEGAKALFYSGDGTTVAPKPSAAKPDSRAAAAKPKLVGVPPVATAGRPVYIGLKYWLELIDTTGQRREVTPDRVFRSGERIKLRIEPNHDGYLYLVNIGSTGRYHLLFPDPRIGDGGNAVRARTIYDVPYGAFIRFDDNPGEETLLVVLSPTPLSDVDLRADTRTRALPSADGQHLLQAAQLRGAKDLTLETDPQDTQPRAYAVAPLASLGDRGILSLEIKLRHR